MGNVPALPHGRPLTRLDLEAMPHDGHRYELVDGVLTVSPSPRPLHQRAILRLIMALEPHCPEQYEILPAPVDVVLAEDTVLIPDVVLAHVDDWTERGLFGPPLLAVEVFSPSTKRFDLDLKRARMQAAGCPNYWVVDPDEPALRCWALREGRYEEVAHVRGEESAVLATPFPVTLCPAELISPRRR
ncbi:Uma2 family endonuclease [Crossiella equi]|uniref:Uma2 family endonuclease n=1 Tax=Crossiella equi TaxID=130796 RepID=A0ABS5AIW1_9PSEU|nr:Uma2 family endonuclease [Crossiella equi]MBP2476322.1 Uma2 family endonuclease [Crossiella equi]